MLPLVRLAATSALKRECHKFWGVFEMPPTPQLPPRGFFILEPHIFPSSAPSNSQNTFFLCTVFLLTYLNLDCAVNFTCIITLSLAHRLSGNMQHEKQNEERAKPLQNRGATTKHAHSQHGRAKRAHQPQRTR